MNARLRSLRGALAAAYFTALAGAVPRVLAASAEGEDIRDIRGPKLVLPWWLAPAALAALALAALLAFGLWRWLQRRRRARALLPFEIALQRLEEIRPLMQPPRAREFSTAVSDVVRGYIEIKFAITATHQTTEEFLHDLLESSNTALLRHRAQLSEFLHQCDLVKFAGLSLTQQNMESLHHSARAFVLETARPEPEAAASGAAPAGVPRPTTSAAPASRP